MIKKITMPKLGETMEEGEIIKWLKEEGEKVEKGEPLLEIATDKANMEVESPETGYLRKIVAKEGEKVPVTEIIAYLTDSMEEEIPSVEGKAEVIQGKRESETAFEEKREERVKASPLARKLARERGIDLTEIRGTGPGGRIVKEDVLRALEEKEAASAVEKVAAREEFSLSRVEKIMAERMEESKREIPHFYLTVEVDFSEVVKLRGDLLEEFEEEKKVHLTYTDFIIKACARALKKFPKVNSHYKDGKIITFSNVNLGLAVARENGLVVPVIKDADKKDIFEIAGKREELVKKAVDDKLSLEDIEGGTFTLSNLGMMGIKNFMAIINPPQVCILATGKIEEKVIANEEEIVVAPVMEMTLSCDHRVVDGYLGSKFLQEVKKGLEKPALLLI
ncbi:2-oxo acid dehydrogenase subunit E2 [Candidatus Aerophobetes bacterium]|nr:2-oxo acid dehydrogenase subunit E2 [Candidatus Aerophobetes bacterium]